MKHLKSLGLAALAVVALTATAGASSAAAFEFHASAGMGTSLSSQVTNPHFFTLTGAEFTCKTISLTGSAEGIGGAGETQKLHPSYTNCEVFGSANVIINTEGCQYKINANTNTVDLEGCAKGGINVVFGTGCSYFYPNQAGINGITYVNEGTTPNRRVIVKTASNNIKANVTAANGFGCFFTEGGKHNNGKYSGEIRVTPSSGEFFWS